jgi:hypothetical protein
VISSVDRMHKMNRISATEFRIQRKNSFLREKEKLAFGNGN